MNKSKLSWMRRFYHRIMLIGTALIVTLLDDPGAAFAAPTPKPAPPAPLGIGDFLPNGANFSLLSPAQVIVGAVGGLLLAIALIGSFIGTVIGLIQMVAAGKDKDKTADAAGRVKVGAVVFFIALIITPIFLIGSGIAGKLTA